MKSSLKADLMLLLVTLAWGSSYYLMDVALGEIGVFSLNALRFLGAFIVACIFFFGKIAHPSASTLLYSAAVGLALYLVYVGATFGVKYTSLSNSAFLCALTVIFVPVIEFLIFRKKVRRRMFIATAVSLLGVMLLTMTDDFGINSAHLKGDFFCLTCAFFYACDLIMTDKAVQKPQVDAFQLGVYQLGFTGLFMLISSFPAGGIELPRSPSVIFAVVFLSLFCTGAAFIIQAVAQQYTSASHVGIIFTMEPVFAEVVALFIAHERMSPKSAVGALLMFAALLMAEIEPKKNRNGER